MTLHVITLEEKLAVVEKAITDLRKKARQDPVHRQNSETLKAIAADLRARIELPRSNALGELTRALTLAKAKKTALGYEHNWMIYVANIIIHKWPTISQALEQFGEESAE